jgi:ATP-dependent DNA helicase RecG
LPEAPAAVPVSELKGIGPKKAAALGRVGVQTVADLLHCLPRSYQDRTAATPIASLSPGDDAVVVGRVLGIKQGRGRKARFLEVAIEDGSGSLLATWFQPQRWLRDALQIGREVVLMGRTDARFPPLRLTHPEFEAPDPESPHRGGVVPVYAPADGFGPRAWRALVHQAIERFADDVADPVPPDVRREAGMLGRAAALRVLHFPGDGDDVEALRRGDHAAHEALLWEDLFVLQTALARRREQRRSRPASPFPPSGLRASLQAALPFELTPAQVRVLAEVDGDLESPRPMLRLLQGDVGSGKTIVALLAAANVVSAGRQTAVLAPTEVLAEQWFGRACALYGHDRVVLLTGSLNAADRRAADARIQSGCPIVLGTHALVSDGTEFADLGLAIVDEQHRFGVFQRARLRSKGAEPHLLAMTATPIPRSLALTLFGDLDVSTLDSTPLRGPMVTEYIDPARRPEVWTIVRRAALAGGRVYIVCPRVEGVGAGRAAVDTAEELAEGALEGIRLGVLHGRMPAAAKRAVLERFRDGSIAVLIGTTVVEVGVDVPEATVMVVEDAHRFGLAQLHQLRGRVGRSARGGRCLLVGEPHPRLDLLVEVDDGFALADADLALRGPGDLVGTRQAGSPAFALCTSPRFGALLASARTAARILACRPDYGTAPQLARLRAAVDARLPAAEALQSG